jgi:hypothetical protein
MVTNVNQKLNSKIYHLNKFVIEHFKSPIERGRGGMCGSRGVMRLAYQSRNTPLHPSQEGNRTRPFELLVNHNTLAITKIILPGSHGSITALYSMRLPRRILAFPTSLIAMTWAYAN